MKKKTHFKVVHAFTRAGGPDADWTIGAAAEDVMTVQTEGGIVDETGVTHKLLQKVPRFHAVDA